jgi:hypothetical protein
MTTRWNKLSAKKNIKCNCFNRPFAAMFGCTGKATHWRYGVYNLGRQSIDYACDVCKNESDADGERNHSERQARLRQVQDAAGVENYRYVKTAWIDGRPQLVKP